MKAPVVPFVRRPRPRPVDPLETEMRRLFPRLSPSMRQVYVDLARETVAAREDNQHDK